MVVGAESTGHHLLRDLLHDFLSKKNVMLEREPIQRLLKKNQIAAFRHEKFWYCMDNLRDKTVLEQIYQKKKAYRDICLKYIRKIIYLN